jgi:glycosyltransferase involved in cell wall biosynthesis
MVIKISIITPSFNQGKYISKTIDSILKQNLGSDLEYIIIDSLSSDNTDEIVNNMLPAIKKSGIAFKYLREKDNGQSDAINKGWRMARGEVVAWLNSDDEYYPNALYEVISFFEKNKKIEWAYGGWSYTNEIGDVYKTVIPKSFSKISLLSYDNIGQPACFIRGRVLNKAGFLNIKLRYTMDYDLWLRLSEISDPGIIKKTIAKLRCYSTTKSSGHSYEQFTSVYSLNSKYSKPLSLLRIKQLLFAGIGMLLGALRLDIANRINKKIRLPLVDY